MKRQLVCGLILGFLCFVLITACASADTAGALFETDIALSEGETTTHFSVWPSEEHAEGFPDDPALLVQVAPPDGEEYSFLFSSYENSETDTLAPLLRFKDMNGDGFLDVEALCIMGASNVTNSYFLYHPADNRLHYSTQLGRLPNAYYDPEQHVILSQISDGAARRYYSLFGIEEGTPVLLRTAYMEADYEDDLYVLHLGVVSASTGELLLEMTSLLDEGEEAAVFDALYIRLMEVLYEGENLSPDEE